MNSVQALKQSPVWQGVANKALNMLIEKAEVVHMEPGTIITEQFKSASDFYLLCEGSVDHYVTLLTDHPESISVGRLDQSLSVIGWSGLLEPNRYTTETRCASSVTLLRWSSTYLSQIADYSPETYSELLRLARDSSKALLGQSRRLLCGEPGSGANETADSGVRCEPARLKLDPDSGLKYLTLSSLFQDLKLNELEHLARHCSMVRFLKGETLYVEGDYTENVLLLIKGKIDLSYQTTASRLFVRSLSQPGHIISWACLTRSQCEDISATAAEDSLLCCIPASVIMEYGEARTAFSINLSKKLLQIIGSRLRATRALIINKHTKSEQATVSSLLHNVGPQLGIDSPLHKVPYLLRSKVTQEDSFRYIDRMQQEGSQFEKNVAGLCSDILRETRREYEFYNGLRSIYKLVVNSSKSEDPVAIRNKSATAFTSLFGSVRHNVKGEENLPENAGHIFVMNHLISHPSHQLANGFEFALDTHFLSAMILLRKYGDSGVRVVRNSRSAEYGHESYYNRLGHIHVYTDESQPVADSGVRLNARNDFFRKGTEQLEHGYNVIICPEGTSYWSQQSPGPFRSGAFRLAAMQGSDTLVVPVSVADFDKPIQEATFTAIIHPPVRVRDFADGDDPLAMKAFIDMFQTQYQQYVRDAQQLSRQPK